MRRWIGVVVLLVVLAGCSPPAGTDGRLTDDWPAFPGASVFRPKADECHGKSLYYPEGPTGYQRDLAGYRPIACTEPHLVETVHVGAFAGEHADRTTPPAKGSPGHRAAFAECATKTTEYLGDDFRTGRVWLAVGTPSAVAWSGSARWFTCDLWEYRKDDEWNDAADRGGPLRNALRGDRPLAFGCYAVTRKANNEIDKVNPEACDKAHNAEFAGIAVAKDVPYPKNDTQEWEVIGKRCWPTVGTYAGLKNDSTLERRVHLIYQGLGETEWNRGNRGVRCWLRLDRNVTKSMRGAGPGAFPVR